MSIEMKFAEEWEKEFRANNDLFDVAEFSEFFEVMYSATVTAYGKCGGQVKFVNLLKEFTLSAFRLVRDWQIARSERNRENE